MFYLVLWPLKNIVWHIITAEMAPCNVSFEVAVEKCILERITYKNVAWLAKSQSCDLFVFWNSVHLIKIRCICQCFRMVHLVSKLRYILFQKSLTYKKYSDSRNGVGLRRGKVTLPSRTSHWRVKKVFQ